jgi:protein-S-isoprenylcysteine O-methyltransferase Ste14
VGRTAHLSDLTGKAILGLAQLVLTLGLLLFAPAWTFNYPLGWFYLGIFATSAALITAYLAKHDPALLERRIRAGPRAESAPLQQAIQAVAALSFAGMFLVASLDHRFSWSGVPVVVASAGDVAVAFGFLFVFAVFRENTYTAATIEIAPDQTVVSTGPYAAVRHPMYAGALILLAGTPPALGSWWALCLLAPMTIAIVRRLLDEEAFLETHLRDYADYEQRVRYRLVPRVW